MDVNHQPLDPRQNLLRKFLLRDFEVFCSSSRSCAVVCTCLTLLFGGLEDLEPLVLLLEHPSSTVSRLTIRRARVFSGQILIGNMTSNASSTAYF